MYRGSNEAARLVIPDSCRLLPLNEAHCSKLATHFGAKKMHKLLSGGSGDPTCCAVVGVFVGSVRSVSNPRTVHSPPQVYCSHCLCPSVDLVATPWIGSQVSHPVDHWATMQFRGSD